MQLLKPIETVFDGYRFRSRLEARWAVFFKTLGIPYEYEKEGYDLDGVWYLPDFWMPSLDCWIEIKFEAPTDIEVTKAEKLCLTSQKPVYIFYGSKLEPLQSCDKTIGVHGDRFRFMVDKHKRAMVVRGTKNFSFNECSVCHKIAILYWGDSDSMPCSCSAEHRRKCVTEGFGDLFVISTIVLRDIWGREDIEKEDYITLRLRNAMFEGMFLELKEKGLLRDAFSVVDNNTPRLSHAYAAARQARCEHGETPTFL